MMNDQSAHMVANPLVVNPRPWREKAVAQLTDIYGAEQARTLLQSIEERMLAFQDKRTSEWSDSDSASADSPFSERDVVLITYGDQIQEPGTPPLQTLSQTLDALVGDVINSVHILPFYPWSSDDGFSVINYTAVDPTWGAWTDVREMSTRFQLMFDAVINHISSESEWFERYRMGDAPYTTFFIEMEPTPALQESLARVVRPRTSPLLTPIETDRGTRHVWTTFSDDQIDLNYASPDLLLAIIDVFLPASLAASLPSALSAAVDVLAEEDNKAAAGEIKSWRVLGSDQIHETNATLILPAYGIAWLKAQP